jgi:hypothetical protein
MKNDVGPEPVEPKPQDKQKKPYVKPAFRYEKVFVTSALSCGKVSGTCSSTVTKAS